MKTRKAILGVLGVLLVLILATGQYAFAQRGYNKIGGGTLWDDWCDKNAPGNKMYGTLAIHYQRLMDQSTCAPDYDTRMTFVMRLSQNNALYVTSSEGLDEYDNPKTVCWMDVTDQKDIIFRFFQSVLGQFAIWKLKTVDGYVDTHYPLGDLDYATDFFTVLDFTIAVQN